jgi:hypothetical protein
MSYEGAQQARQHMKVPCEIIRVPQVSLFLNQFEIFGNQNWIQLIEFYFLLPNDRAGTLYS